MGSQIIRQPDGRYAVFSTVTGTVIVYDAAVDELVEWFAERAAEEARRSVGVLLEHIEDGRPQDAYGRWAMSWEDALTSDQEHAGMVHRDFLPGEHATR